MNDRPIREDHPTEVELLLLRSVQVDAPSRSSKGRALAALGLAAATATAGTGGAATAGAVATGLAKWIAVGTVAVIAVGATQALGRRAITTVPVRSVGEHAGANHVPPQSPLPSRLLEPRLPPLADSSSSPPTATVAPTPALHTAGPTLQPAHEFRRSPEAAPSPPSPPSGLAAEVSSLESVRSKLAAHDANAARQLLDLHDARFTEPSLGPEAALLRMEVLLAVGDIQGARRIGHRLLSEQPDSAYGQRVRSLLEEAVTRPVP